MLPRRVWSPPLYFFRNMAPVNPRPNFPYGCIPDPELTRHRGRGLLPAKPVNLQRLSGGKLRLTVSRALAILKPRPMGVERVSRPRGVFKIAQAIVRAFPVYMVNLAPVTGAEKRFGDYPMNVNGSPLTFHFQADTEIAMTPIGLNKEPAGVRVSVCYDPHDTAPVADYVAELPRNPPPLFFLTFRFHQS